MKGWIVKYWLTVLFGLITTGVTTSYAFLKKKLDCQNKEQEAIKMGLQALLRNEIIREYNKYIRLGSIPIYAMENMDAMYEQYSNLGGNGTITTLMEKIRELPTENVEL